MARNTLNSPANSDGAERDTFTQQHVEPASDATVRNVGSQRLVGNAPMNEQPMTETVRTHEEYAQPQPQPLRQESTPAWVAANDRVRWGPVWAGLLTAIATILVLELLAYALGLLGGGNAGANQSAWISGIIALIGFFFGGWIAESTSAARGFMAGVVNGFMVWVLGVAVIIALVLLGATSLFGAVGSTLGQLVTSGTSVSAPNVSANAVSHVTNLAAWGAFLFLVATAIVAALGGVISSRGNPIGRMVHSRDL